MARGVEFSWNTSLAEYTATMSGLDRKLSIMFLTSDAFIPGHHCSVAWAQEKGTGLGGVVACHQLTGEKLRGLSGLPSGKRFTTIGLPKPSTL